MSLPPFAKAWYAQTVGAQEALARVHVAELRALSDDAALLRSEVLLSLPAVVPDARRATSGLVQQQALFARARLAR